MKRRISVSGTLDINDDETFRTDWCHYVISGIVIVDQDQPSTLLQIVKVCGGEVRVEIDLNAVALNNGDAKVVGTAKLFEGASGKTTDDLDDQKNIDLLVTANNSVSLDLKLENKELKDRDQAVLKLDFDNSLVA